MNSKNIFAKTLLAGAVALLMVGCSADGDGSVTAGSGGGGGLNAGGGGNTIFPNNGTAGGEVTENGNAIGGRFICTASAQKAFGASTEVGVNGLVGTLSPILDLIGAVPATTLLNSVTDKDLAIDGDIVTASTFTLPVGALFGLVDSVDQIIFLPGVQPVGSFAVFGLQFPPGTVQLSLTDTITVTTFLGSVEQETQEFDQLALDLLGFNAIGDSIGFFGIKSTKIWDRATIGLNQLVASANVGPAMKVHELCTVGNFVP